MSQEASAAKANALALEHLASIRRHGRALPPPDDPEYGSCRTRGTRLREAADSIDQALQDQLDEVRGQPHHQITCVRADAMLIQSLVRCGS